LPLLARSFDWAQFHPVSGFSPRSALEPLDDPQSLPLPQLVGGRKPQTHLDYFVPMIVDIHVVNQDFTYANRDF
jgi:hypothetical protein